MALQLFHPVIQRWFRSRYAGPTEPQELGWPHLVAGGDVLIAAPTGSGKTLTAFLASIDRLLRLSLHNELPDEIHVVYVSPLRALSNDMHVNLEVPLAEILETAREMGLDPTPIRVGLRTGDTSSSKRAAIVKRPPQILVTTPESLYLMLTSPKAREKLKTVETIIVDEIHALVRDKRGSHLALTLERLAALCPSRLQRIGLSATQRPIEEIAKFLVGESAEDATTLAKPAATPTSASPRKVTYVSRSLPFEENDPKEILHQQEGVVPSLDDPRVRKLPSLPTIVDVGFQRQLDLAIEVPPSELGAVCMHEQWAEINERIVELINGHRATLIFVNTRRLAERLTHQLSEIMGEDAITSHHGSLAADLRHDTEQRLKSGRLKAVVATASLEMGLDIGYIDLVVQIGSSRNIATFLQRVGRSGHALGLVPKGRLFALTRDELMECMAIIRAVRHGRLDIVPIPVAPLDVLAQQIVAEVACGEWGTDELYSLCRRAYPFRKLSRNDFDRIVTMLSEGITNSAGRSRVYIHHDQVGRRLRARAGARIAAASNAGAIPEVFAIRVVTEEDHTVVGSVDEDFGTESQAGDIFLLGNTSWRIRYLRGGDLIVSDAQGAPPTIPFWRGEAPGRTFELSEEVSILREELEQRIADPQAAEDWLALETSSSTDAARQIVEYARAQKASIGLLPSIRRVVFERFFDESGGMQMVIHAPFGMRITRAWGLAMRKRFCRSFDFELQAQADDDGIVLSLGPQHSFPLESMFGMLTPRNVQDMFEQAVLAVPIFQNRWRWNATRALQVLRARNGQKVPPALQRFRSEDLLTAVFPKLTGCQENVVGDIELPDHPLVRQTMDDCLYEAHDIDALKQVLGRVERGEIEFLARDTREPSPFSYELLNANPYAFLDGGEVAERRARAVATRRSLSVESLQDLGRLDPEAIRQVVADAQPLIRNADELHDALLSRVMLPSEEGTDWREFFLELVESGRATSCEVRLDEASSLNSTEGSDVEMSPSIVWVATERVPVMKGAFPGVTFNPDVVIPVEVSRDWDSIESRVTMVRGLLETCGPITGEQVARRLGFTVSQSDAALEALEGEGVVLRGRFTEESRLAANGTEDETTSAEVDCENVPDRDEIQRELNGGPLAQCASEAENEALCCDHRGHCGVDAVPIVKMQANIEWCHRRLLARIHRLTLDGLRKQIEPVTVDTFIRFLTRHHGVVHGHRRGGANGLFEVIGQLQGIDIPAVAWERDLLPLRLEEYRPDWIDELCLTGEVGWGRLFPPARNENRAKPMASITRVAPIAFYLRQDVDWLTAFAPDAETEGLGSASIEVIELLMSRGAMFASDLLATTRMLPSQLEDVLGELVSRGWITADGFAGLRSLIPDKRNSGRAKPRHRAERTRMAKSAQGRWSLRSPGDRSDLNPKSAANDGVSVAEINERRKRIAEDWAWQLLRRWGVVFRDLLVRENGAPPWFEVLQVLRRLEARGEIRGGRFISGVAGEQFALAESISQLRKLRDQGPCGEIVVISAADPLNLVGILTKHDRVPSTASNRIAYLDGHPIASMQAEEVQWLGVAPDSLRKEIEQRLRGRTDGLDATSFRQEKESVAECRT